MLEDAGILAASIGPCRHSVSGRGPSFLCGSDGYTAGCDGDGVAEFLQFADEVLPVPFGVPAPAGVPVSAEVLVDGIVRGDVPVGDEKPALETVLQHVEHRLPAHARRFHPDDRHPALGKPVREQPERTPGHRERPCLGHGCNWSGL